MQSSKQIEDLIDQAAGFICLDKTMKIARTVLSVQDLDTSLKEQLTRLVFREHKLKTFITCVLRISALNGMMGSESERLAKETMEELLPNESEQKYFTI
jgi:hypothetical protein